MSEIVTKLLEEIKELKVLELNELVKALEEEFGVSAAAFAVAAPAGVKTHAFGAVIQPGDLSAAGSAAVPATKSRVAGNSHGTDLIT